MNHLDYEMPGEKNHGLNVTNDVMPMSAVLDKACCASNDACAMVARINNHMFGVCEPRNDDVKTPECFQDMLEQHTMNLSKLCKSLEFIMQRLGV